MKQSPLDVVNALNPVNAQPWNWEITYKEKNQNRGGENAKDREYQWDRTWSSSWSSQILLMGQVMAQPLWKTGWWLLTRINLHLPCNLTSSPPGTDTIEMHLLVSPRHTSSLHITLKSPNLETTKLPINSKMSKWISVYSHDGILYRSQKPFCKEADSISSFVDHMVFSALVAVVQCRMQP